MSKLNRGGQALLELAIFGSILILVLGVLIQYGMNADMTQRVSMTAFRRALGLAGPRGVSVSVVRDYHIPSPSSPSGIGSVYAAAGSGPAIVRDFKLEAGSGSGQMSVDINGNVRQYTVGGGACEGEILSKAAVEAACKTTPNLWCCSKIDQLFRDTNQMGPQQGTTRTTDMTNTLQKRETDQGIANDTTIVWRDQVRRDIITRPLGDESGHTKHEVLTTNVKDENSKTTWETSWE